MNVVQPTAERADAGDPAAGHAQAFTDAPIYARASGYLKGWNVDIGAHVKQGQLLAEIETPEVDQQLAAGPGRPRDGAGQLQQAQITADRWRALLKSDSVSKQETDQAVSALAPRRPPWNPTPRTSAAWSSSRGSRRSTRRSTASSSRATPTSAS